MHLTDARHTATQPTFQINPLKHLPASSPPVLGLQCPSSYAEMRLRDRRIVAGIKVLFRFDGCVIGLRSADYRRSASVSSAGFAPYQHQSTTNRPVLHCAVDRALHEVILERLNLLFFFCVGVRTDLVTTSARPARAHTHTRTLDIFSVAMARAVVVIT